MMQGSVYSRFSRLVLSGLVMLAIGTPAHAANCVKEAVNRTGLPQAEVFARLAGLPEITGVLFNEPFGAVQGLAVLADAGFDTLIRFFGAPGGAIPSTDAPDAPATSKTKTGFSVAGPDFVIARWSWCGSELAAPFRRIADPSFHFGFIGDPKDRMVKVTMRNDSGEEVLCRNLVFSARSRNPGLRGVQLLSGPSDDRTFGEVVMQRQSQLILPPFSGNGEIPQGVAEFVMQLPRSLPLDDLNVFCRAILFRRIRQGNTTLTDDKNPVSLAAWHDVSETFAVRLFDVCVQADCVPGDANKHRVQISLAGCDPDSPIDGTAAVPTIDQSVSAEAGSVEVKNVKRTVTRDFWNRPVAHIQVDADLKEGSQTRYFRFRFTGKSQGQSTVRDVQLWLTPSGQLYGDW